MDDIAVMVAEAVAKRVKEAQARQAATVKGAASAAPQPQAVARPPAPAFAGAGPLLSAFILREALDKPLALREGPRF